MTCGLLPVICPIDWTVTDFVKVVGEALSIVFPFAIDARLVTDEITGRVFLSTGFKLKKMIVHKQSNEKKIKAFKCFVYNQSGFKLKKW